MERALRVSPRSSSRHNAEFFEYIEKHYGDKLPVFRGSAGTYWEDGAGSSARETALYRNAHEAVANGEKFLALADRIGRTKPYHAGRRSTSAWRNCLLYDEHTWGAYCSISQPESEFTKAQWKIKAQFAVDAAAAGQGDPATRGARPWPSLVRTDGPALVVFNPTSWPRTDVVRGQAARRAWAWPIRTSPALRDAAGHAACWSRTCRPAATAC